MSDDRAENDRISPQTAGEIGERLKAVRRRRGMSLRVVAGLAGVSAPYLSMVETGKRSLDRYSLIRDLAEALRVPASDLAPGLSEARADSQAPSVACRDAGPEPGDSIALVTEHEPDLGDELGAIEAARRAGATDVGAAAMEQLEQLVDVLAMAYPSTAPSKLLSKAGTWLEYVTGMLGGRMTLSEHRGLLVISGWLSLLTATSLIDLRRGQAAEAYLNTAMRMAGEAGHAELGAWCLETQAWQAVSSGQYSRAVSLAQGAEHLAPRGSSALIQATAQEGRAWSRLGAARDTYDALARVEALVSPLAVPDQPEHHYHYDPSKAEAYVATTLSWLGDPAAVDIARSVLTRMESSPGARPRRAVAARIDLALALVGAGQEDEATGIALEAVRSPYLVPSNYWRADEVANVLRTNEPEGSSVLREAISARRLRQPESSETADS